jgi:hypothetical protein
LAVVLAAFPLKSVVIFQTEGFEMRFLNRKQVGDGQIRRSPIAALLVVVCATAFAVFAAGSARAIVRGESEAHVFGGTGHGSVGQARDDGQLGLDFGPG